MEYQSEYEQIAELYKSKEYMSITSYYGQKNIFEILGVSRLENIHSNFLAWLFNPSENHGYGTFPMQQFLRLLAVTSRTYPCNKDIQIDKALIDRLLIGNKVVESAVIEREVCIKDKNRLDMVLEVHFKEEGKLLPVIIENKVKSNEHRDSKDKQTNYYYKWGIEKYADSNKYEKPLFVFLSPKYDAQLLIIEKRKDICACDSFIMISYQDIMKHVLEPCKNQDSSEYAKLLVKNYMRCLSDSKGGVMAMESETKELLVKFWDDNKELWLKVFDAKRNDSDTDDEQKAIIDSLTASMKDYTKYIFNNVRCGKGKLVLAVVKQYVDDNKNITFSELENKFPKTLQGSLGVFAKIDDIEDNSRYYVKNQDQIQLADGTVIAVCNQWGATKSYNKESNIDRFLDNAKKLGYTIRDAE